jgi:hypothetical protein
LIASYESTDSNEDIFFPKRCAEELLKVHTNKNQQRLFAKKKKSWNQHVTNSNRNFANLMEVEI